MAAAGDLVGDVADLEGGRLRLGLGDEGAHPLDAGQHPFQAQLPERAVDGHAADRKIAHQIGLGGDLVAALPFALGDAVGDHPFHAGIARQRLGFQANSPEYCSEIAVSPETIGDIYVHV
jgi:hypothetical protein